MPRPKSIIKRIEFDVAKKAHNCQHNKNHRIERGEARLKVWKERSAEHYCSDCALNIISRDISHLQLLAEKFKNNHD